MKKIQFKNHQGLNPTAVELNEKYLKGSLFWDEEL